MTESVASTLIDPETGLFRWWNRSDRSDLYQAGVGWPLLSGIVDGFGAPASWQQAQGASKSETLFRALRAISDTWNAFYIKHQDDSYAEIDWERPLDTAQLTSVLLDEFSVNPAAENGSAFLGLFPDGPENLVLFCYAPGQFFRISLYGDMKRLVPEALTKAGAA